MEKLLKASKDLQTELIEWRRYLHANAETGFDLPKTTAFIEEKLRGWGYEVKPCGKGSLTATVGKGSKTFLLRADVDALPIKEEVKTPYACAYGNMHACGHDMHATMLLGAAKLLKEREAELSGQIKLLFQAAEEILEGAKDAVEKGALKAPAPDAGMMLHVLTSAALPTGTTVVATGTSAPSADFFRIRVQGKGCHGSAPWKGVDALTIAARILLALEELSARELPVAEGTVLTVGSLHAGEAANVIADSAELKGTFRTFDEGTRNTLKKRVKELAEGIAKAFRAEAEVCFEGGCPTLVNDEGLSLFVKERAAELLGAERVFFDRDLQGDTRKNSGGSEDFAYISQELPTVMLALFAGEKEKGYEYPLHHPKATFDEDALSVGAALYATIAIEWLAANGAGKK